MKQIKVFLLLIFIGGLFSCGQKKESEQLENSEIVVVETPQFSDNELQRYVDEYDEYVERFFEMYDNNEFQSEEGEIKLEKFKNNFEKFQLKMRSVLEETMEEKEFQKFDEYFENKQAEIKQRTGNLLEE